MMLCLYSGLLTVALNTLGGADFQQAKAGTSVVNTGDWIWLLIGCVVLLAALFAAFRARKSREGTASHVLYGQSSATPAQKLAILKPVVEQVLKQHRLSRFGFDICPENIRIVRGRAVPRLRSATVRRDGTMAVSAGFSAPERYDAAQPVGPWADVYAVSALLFDAITGSAPPPAYERADDEPVFTEPVPSGFETLAAAVEQGLTVDFRKRPAYLDSLWTELQHVMYRERVSDSKEEVAYIPAKNAAAHAQHKGVAYRIAMIACAVCVLLGGALLVLEINYTQALSHIEGGAFAKAAKSINGVPAFYRDAGDMQRFVEAVNLLDEGYYGQAAALFEALGDYRDARRMVTETAYQSAVQLLESGSFDEAQAAFAALSGYADAPQMVTEARYRKAASAMQDGKLTEAMAMLEALHPYKDSANLLAVLSESTYAQALANFEQGLYAQAASYFAAVSGYQEADSYGALCELAERIEQGDFSRMHFELLMTYADSFDIADFVLSDGGIRYYLEGRWQDGAGHAFTLYEDGGISCSLPLPKGSYYELRGAALMVGQNAGDTQALGFEYVDADNVLVYCVSSGTHYTLARRR